MVVVIKDNAALRHNLLGRLAQDLELPLLELFYCRVHVHVLFSPQIKRRNFPILVIVTKPRIVVELAVMDCDRFTGQTDQPFDVVERHIGLLRLLRILEYHHLVALGHVQEPEVQVVHELGDQYAVAGVIGRPLVFVFVFLVLAELDFIATIRAYTADDLHRPHALLRIHLARAAHRELEAALGALDDLLVAI